MQLPRLDLNLLRSLDILLQERNVTRAAEQLNVTQQAMSGSLKRLREQFGDELLIKVGRELKPTPLGAALQTEMHELMQHVARAVQTTPVFHPERSQKRTRIAMSDYSALTVLPAFMRVLSVNAPRMVCDVRPLGDNIFNDLDAGSLEFCILPHKWRLHQEALPMGIKSQHLYSDDFVCVVDENNDIGATLELETYCALPHNSLRLGGEVRSVIENAWTLNELSLNVVAFSGSFSSLVAMVVGTKIVATVQRRLAQIFERALPIRIYECPIHIETLKETLSWHERNDDDLAHSFIRECFEGAC